MSGSVSLISCNNKYLQVVSILNHGEDNGRMVRTSDFHDKGDEFEFFPELCSTCIYISLGKKIYVFCLRMQGCSAANVTLLSSWLKMLNMRFFILSSNKTFNFQFSPKTEVQSFIFCHKTRSWLNDNFEFNSLSPKLFFTVGPCYFKNGNLMRRGMYKRQCSMKVLARKHRTLYMKWRVIEYRMKICT